MRNLEKWRLDYDQLNKEFELSLEDEEFVISQIRKKMTERFEWIQNIIGDIISPTGETIIVMHECKFFSDSERKDLIHIYKKIQYHIRAFNECDLLKDEQREVESIKSAFADWMQLKENIRPYLAKLKECWIKDSDIKETLRYFG